MSRARPSRLAHPKQHSSREASFRSYISSNSSKKRIVKTKNDSSTDEESVSRNGKKRKHIDWKQFHNPMVPKPKLKRSPGPVQDYLKEK